MQGGNICRFFGPNRGGAQESLKGDHSKPSQRKFREKTVFPPRIERLPRHDGGQCENKKRPDAMRHMEVNQERSDGFVVASTGLS